MRPAAALLVVVAASTAFADDDPDLFVVSGRIAADGGAPVHVRLDRLVVQCAGFSNTDRAFRESTVPQGEAFRFVGLPPGRYDLVVDGADVTKEARTIDVFDDVADVDVRPGRAPARIEGKLTLEIDCDLKCVGLVSGDATAKVLSDGRFSFDGLPAGAAWIDAVGYRPTKSSSRRDQYFRRRTRVELRPGVNRVEIRLARDDEVRLAVRSPNPEESFTGDIFDPDDPSSLNRGEPFSVIVGIDSRVNCYEIDCDGVDSTWWRNFGPTLPLSGLGRGPHRVRIEAPGFETVERAFDVAGPMRVDVELKPLPGQFVRIEARPITFVLEERRADRTWAPLYVHGFPDVLFGRRQNVTPRVFLAPGVHVLRASASDAPPSHWETLEIGDDRREVATYFSFETGKTMTGRLVTKAGTALDGFDVRCFRLVGERWERLRAQDAVAKPGFNVAGLAPGRYRLAFDEDGKHVFAEFDMGAEDVEREFTYRAR